MVTHTTRAAIVYQNDERQTVEVSGSFPCCIVYVRCGSNNLMRKFDRTVARLLADCEAVETVRGEDGVERATAYRVWGSESALAEISDHPAVIRWHYVSAVRVPSAGTARGDERAKVHDHIRPADAGAKRTIRHARANRDGKRVIEHDELNPERVRRLQATEPGKRPLAAMEPCFTSGHGFTRDTDAELVNALLLEYAAG